MLVRCLLTFVSAVPYHSLINLPATSSQPRTSIIFGHSNNDSLYFLALCFKSNAVHPQVIMFTIFCCFRCGGGRPRRPPWRLGEERGAARVSGHPQRSSASVISFSSPPSPQSLRLFLQYPPPVTPSRRRRGQGIIHVKI